jgi:hypothetical protein
LVTLLSQAFCDLIVIISNPQFILDFIHNLPEQLQIVRDIVQGIEYLYFLEKNGAGFEAYHLKQQIVEYLNYTYETDKLCFLFYLILKIILIVFL